MSQYNGEPAATLERLKRKRLPCDRSRHRRGGHAASGCGQIPSPPPAPDAPASSVAHSPVPGASKIGGDAGDVCEYSVSGDAARPVAPPPTAGVPTSGTISYVLAMTNGKVTITLDRANAPCTVNSFVSLADQGYFDKTTCHRLADSGIFVLQCGDPTGTGNGGPGYEFANETDGTESPIPRALLPWRTAARERTVHSSSWSGPTRPASIRSRILRSSAR